MSASEHLELLLRVNAVLNSTKSLDRILDDLIVEVIQTLKAERGFVVLRDGNGWQSAASHYVDVEQRLAATQFSKSIVATVAAEERALVLVDALESEYGHNPSIVMGSLRSIVCAPLRWGGGIQGVVYADHSVKSGVFKDEHLELLVAIADQASRALEAAALNEQLRRLQREHLGLYSESQAASKTLDLLLGSLTSTSGLEPVTLRGVQAPPSDDARVLVSKRCRVRLFGPLRVDLDNQVVSAWKSRKDRGLFAYLAAHQGQVVNEEELVELFWSKGGSKAQHSLHNSITQIRKVLGDAQRELVQRTPDGYTLGPCVWTDLEEFRWRFQDGKRAALDSRWDEALSELSKAEDLAHDELLQGSLAEWLTPIRVRVSQQLVQCRELLADYFRQRGKHLMVIELWKRVLEQDNCNDAAYSGLVQSYLELGKRSEAVKAYQACVKAYSEELDLPPPVELTELLDS